LYPSLPDSTTACTIATSIVHSKLDPTVYKLPKSQITRLQLIQNSLARAVVKAPKSCHITPVLRSLHWLWDAACCQITCLNLMTPEEEEIAKSCLKEAGWI